MSGLTRRTQFLLDEERYERLDPPERPDAVSAARALLGAEPMPVEDWSVMKRELRPAACPRRSGKGDGGIGRR